MTFLVVYPNIFGRMFHAKKYMNWPRGPHGWGPCHGTNGTMVNPVLSAGIFHGPSLQGLALLNLHAVSYY